MRLDTKETRTYTMAKLDAQLDMKASVLFDLET